MQKFRILSIDGGGLRGVVPLTILRRIESMTGKRIHEMFDLIAGTSTGGLITCAISIKDPKYPLKPQPLHSVDEVLDLYLERGKEIFPPRGFLSFAKNLFTPKYNSKGLDHVLNDFTKTYRLSDCLSNVMVCSYDLNSNSPLFFKSRYAAQDPNLDALLFDICKATSAGPTYLPSYEFQYPRGKKVNCIDGGVFVNNPSLSALAEFSKHNGFYLGAQLNEIDYNNVYVLSLGTGGYTGVSRFSGVVNKGDIYWAPNITDIMMHGVNEATNYEMNEMMVDGNYLRLTIDINNPKYCGMDNSKPEASRYLVDCTYGMLEKNSTSLKTFLRNL